MTNWDTFTDLLATLALNQRCYMYLSYHEEKNGSLTDLTLDSPYQTNLKSVFVGNNHEKAA